MNCRLSIFLNCFVLMKIAYFCDETGYVFKGRIIGVSPEGVLGRLSIRIVEKNLDYLFKEVRHVPIHR